MLAFMLIDLCNPKLFARSRTMGWQPADSAPQPNRRAPQRRVTRCNLNPHPEPWVVSGHPVVMSGQGDRPPRRPEPSRGDDEGGLCGGGLGEEDQCVGTLCGGRAEKSPWTEGGR